MSKEQVKAKSNFVIMKYQVPRITIFEDKGYNDVLHFKDRNNLDYELIKEEINEIGYTDDYRDYIKRALDPNQNKNLSYGFGRKFQPMTKTINEMKQSIDDANSIYQEMLLKEKESKANSMKKEIKEEASQISNKIIEEINNNDK